MTSSYGSLNEIETFAPTINIFYVYSPFTNADESEEDFQGGYPGHRYTSVKRKMTNRFLKSWHRRYKSYGLDWVGLLVAR